MPTDVCDLTDVHHSSDSAMFARFSCIFSSHLTSKLTFSYFTDWTTLFFQETQGLSALEAALRFLPLVFVGIGTNIAAGLLVDKVSAGILVSMGGLVSAGTETPQTLSTLTSTPQSMYSDDVLPSFTLIIRIAGPRLVVLESRLSCYDPQCCEHRHPLQRQ